MKRDVYEEMRISMMNSSMDTEEVIEDVPIVEKVDKKEETTTNNIIDYSKYLGVLEIPRIGLKRGFYNTDS